MDRHKLKKAGLSVTSPRLKVLEALAAQQQHHVSARGIHAWVRDDGETFGLGTVYRVLDNLERAGIVVRHNFEGKASVFELYDGTPHDHMFRRDTGEVVEFRDPRIEQRCLEIAAERGFDVQSHALVLYVRRR